MGATEVALPQKGKRGCFVLVASRRWTDLAQTSHLMEAKLYSAPTVPCAAPPSYDIDVRQSASVCVSRMR